jgi:hypothetical protein
LDLFIHLFVTGHYENGIASGICWRGLIGGAWLYGKVDDKGTFTGKYKCIK